MANDTFVPYSLDDYFQTTPIGSLDKAIGNNLYGINHRQVANMVPSNKDTYGLTFFVRPQLNMQKDNIRNVRMFSPLLTTEDMSIQNFVKCTLDPRLIHGYSIKGSHPKATTILPATCSIVDNLNAFIPILTNNLNSISGWPDMAISPYTSKTGLYGESYSLVDSTSYKYETFSLDANFRNTKGDPIVYMFYVWLRYMTQVFEGNLVPYLDFISENEIDYNTRIYRLVLDQHKKYVTKIAATGAAFPISLPTGSFFDFNNEKPYNDQNKDISIRFQCMGVDYQDDILIKEFNDTVAIFNPNMGDSAKLNPMSMYDESKSTNSSPRDLYMVKVNRNILHLFNNRGYPRINTSTYELEWYVDMNLWKTRTKAFLDMNIIRKEGNDFVSIGD
jgi:hypothetical protein